MTTALSDFLKDELRYWRKREEDDPKNIIFINGGTCEVLHLIAMIEFVDQDYLRARYKIIRNRKSDSKLYALASASIERDKIRLEAIKRVGLHIKNKIEIELTSNKDEDKKVTQQKEMP
jgi:hypothetical protein